MARGIGLGMAATLIALALHWTGAVDVVEWRTLDVLFRQLPTIRPNPDIVHLALDDNALEQIHRWPWPRQLLGRLVDTLTECGARSVTLDIILRDPEPFRYVKAGQTDVHLGVDGRLLGEERPPVLVMDDVELGEALARGPQVCLAIHLELMKGASGADQDDGDGALVESLAARIATRPALTRAQAAAETRRPLAWVEQVMAAAKERAFRRRVRSFLQLQPDLSAPEMVVKLLGRRETNTENAEIIRRAYLWERGLLELSRQTIPVERVRGLKLPLGRGVPPLVTFARAVGYVGFVNFLPDADGLARRVPLLIRDGDRIYPYLSLVAAAHSLAAEHGGTYEISARKGRVVIACADGFRREIPVDGEGFMLINWAPEDPARHVSAVAAQDVWKARESLRHNRSLYRAACLEINERTQRAFQDEPLDRYFTESDRVWKQLQDLRRSRHLALLFDPARAKELPVELLAKEAELERRIDGGCRKLLAEIDRQLRSAEQAGGEPDDNEREIRRLRKLAAEVEAEEPRIQRQLEGARRRLSERVAGKTVLVGSHATGAADFVPTPLSERTPGVIVHGHALNTMLTGRFVRRPRPWVSGLLVLLAGAFVAVVTAARGPIQAAVLLALAAVAYAFFDGVVWRAASYWLIAVVPIGGMLLCFTVVSVYRQLTESRQKRQITRDFKQFLSPTMVDLLAEDPSQAEPRRCELSCFFSDVAGFTSLSERLGAERTVGIINHYLQRVGEIVQGRHGGTLSKYEGDGLFAFFNAPLPQDDHAARAVRAALECQEIMPAVSRELSETGLLPESAPLQVRVGITSGEAVVGRMGSTRKFSYTAIGDSVNLAARLEAANKSFGTRILLNAAAWQAGRDGVVGRPLGKVLVVGKTEPVVAWEPLAFEDRADEELRRLIEQFARGVELYATGAFPEARACFAAILAGRDDPAARTYVGLCEQAIARPPEAFDGVIRLTEK